MICPRCKKRHAETDYGEIGIVETREIVPNRFPSKARIKEAYFSDKSELCWGCQEILAANGAEVKVFSAV